MTKPKFCRACNEHGHRCRGSLFPKVSRSIYRKQRGRLCRRFHQYQHPNGEFRGKGALETETLVNTETFMMARYCFYCGRRTCKPFPMFVKQDSPLPLVEAR